MEEIEKTSKGMLVKRISALTVAILIIYFLTLLQVKHRRILK